MPDKYQNKYRIPSARLQKWDYRWPAAYYITICTHNRNQYFGNIVNGNMELSAIGIIADVLWHEIKHHNPNVDTDAFIVMPNHIHGIIILIGNDLNVVHPLNDEMKNGEDGMVIPGTGIAIPGATGMDVAGGPGPKSNSLSSIVRSYKSAVSKHVHRLGFDFEWQSRFYDRIIRDEGSFSAIQKYILENPKNWSEDQFLQ